MFLSIIIPIYNAGESLSRCIDSVVNQTYHHLEIILVNDGSTDCTGRLCEEYVKRDNRIKVVHKKNGGVSSARNRGLEVARGEYVMFLDSDDALATDACEVLLNSIAEKNADCIVFGTKEPSGFCWTSPCNKDYASLSDFNCDFGKWLDTELLSPVWNKVYKRDKITKSFHEEMSFGEDLCFALEYMKNCDRISFITNVLHYHDNIKPNSLTHTFNPERYKDIERVQTAILSFVGIGEEPGKDKDLWKKYLRDSINYMNVVCSTPLMSLREKKLLLSAWHDHSYLSQLELSSYDICHKQRLMLALWKKRRISWYLWLLRLKRLF